MNVIIASGGILETSFLPFHISLLQKAFPLFSFHVCLSEKAEEFVSTIALQGITKNLVYSSSVKFDNNLKPVHLEFANQDLVFVYPATPRIIVEASIGNITCPVTRVIAFAGKEKVLFAPTLHPSLKASVYENHVNSLKELGCRFLDFENYPEVNYLNDFIDFIRNNYKEEIKYGLLDLVKKVRPED